MYSGDDSDENQNEAAKKPNKRKAAEAMSHASEELPYTFEAPESLDDFLELIDGRSDDDQITVVKRLLILYNVKLTGANRPKMERLAVILTERILQLADEEAVDLALIKRYQVHSVELCKTFPLLFSKWCKSRVLSLQNALIKGIASKKSVFPVPGDLIWLADLASIYSCSDMHHEVVTPVMLLVCQYLEQAPITTLYDVCAGVYLCRIFASYISDSKRFVPEVLNFLQILFSEMVKSLDGYKASRTIPSIRKIKSDLSISNYGASADPFDLQLLLADGLETDEKADSVKLAVLAEVVALLTKYCKFYSDTTSVIELFESVLPWLDIVPQSCNEVLAKQVAEARRMIGPWVEGAKLRRKPLQLQKRKAIPIKTYVPKFQASYSIDKRYDPDRERAQEGKLRAEYKKEFKGAVRELRKDAAFMARTKLDAIKEADKEYKKKMDKIRGQLAEQEGAMRGYEKASKKDKAKRKKF
ncbi:nucleolar complex protein 14 [Kappamyces sp. JEL0680]|nr:nucleolar complex protein 14 [Kappamyces sp. JEL0680]